MLRGAVTITTILLSCVKIMSAKEHSGYRILGASLCESFPPFSQKLREWQHLSANFLNNPRMLSLPASMKRIRLRTAEKKWRHHFSHYKPMGIFSDFQGQLTPQSVVQSSRNSNSSDLSCMSSLPASMKRIR